MMIKFMFLCLAIAIAPAQAQFKKAKYKSRFKKENFKSAPNVQEVSPPPGATTPSSPSAAPSAANSNPSAPNSRGNNRSTPIVSVPGNNNPPKANVFGRGTGIKNVQKSAEEKKFVNLNPETAFGPEVITSFDFPNTSILDLTKHMQKLTGLNLILAEDIKGKVSILAPSPITVGDAWKAYLTALNLNSLGIVKSGSFYKIINIRDIRYAPTKIYTGSYSPDTENYIMKIIPVKNITASEIARSFRPFLSRYGRILDIKQTNTIIINDTGSNINRVTKLIKFLDVPGHEEQLQIIKVKHSSAQEIAKVLESILKGGSSSKNFKRSSSTSSAGKSSDISKIIAEPRTNSIIALANASGAKKLRQLIAKLDTKDVTSGAGKVHVYYLNYGDSEELSKTLSSLVSSGSSSGASSSRRSSRFSRRSSSSSSESLFTSPVKITSDKENNALVISASPTDYLTLKSVIDKLDIPKDQVYVEGIIMETAIRKQSDWGLSIIGGYGSGATQRAGYTLGSNALQDLTTNALTSIGGLFVGGGSGRTVNLGGATGVDVNLISGVINALATNAQTNVLATPQIMALDNTEANFEVGESVPVNNTTANGAVATTSVTDQTASLSITIKPQINKVTRFIKLDIDQKVDNFSDEPLPDNQSGRAVTKRRAKTTVVVRDRDTIAMGGLMRDQENKTINKIPLLGDIPVLGWLFKRRTVDKTKTNMLFFLTPKIISPYEKTAAKNVKDILNRRNSHIESAIGDDDPFKSTVKGLYKKAQLQDQGPLYDRQDGEFYKRANKDAGIGAVQQDTPNYQEIAAKAQRVKKKMDKRQELKISEEDIVNEDILDDDDIVRELEAKN